RAALVELEMESATAPLEAAVAPAVVAPSGCVFLNIGGVPFRVFGQETGGTITISPTTPGQTELADGGVSAVQQAVAAWTNHPDSAINFVAGPARARNITCTVNTPGDIDKDGGGVVFNDPCSDIPDMVNCAGTLAIGGVAQGGGTNTFDGQAWFGIGSPFVVVNNGAGCIGTTNFAEMMTHEVGHSIGFGHHTGSSPSPTMSSILKGDGRGAALVGVDKTCASFAYHTFRDVSFSHWAWKWIETVDNRNVIAGCGSGNFCPDNNISRDQMATFLLKAKEGSAFTPPTCTSPVFNDVPCSNSFATWINELSARGVTGGCGNGAYCPSGLVSRDQMAVFLLKTKEGPAYSPPACTSQIFNDVPCSNPFAPWINELVARGITGGCGSGNYCPGTNVTRAQMSVFLTATFGLPTP
ncbi:MAG TPA: S-layer homology domain-containing protein, partial [Thermoanaerobaculia bacterium]|nr:S-layer homology domain-containing protein [Thermoanaerobaculia bacterium]